MTAVLIILFDSVCAQNIYKVRKLVRPWPDLHGLTCMGGSPSHEDIEMHQAIVISLIAV